jgi:hypothetical protein
MVHDGKLRSYLPYTRFHHLALAPEYFIRTRTHVTAMIHLAPCATEIEQLDTCALSALAQQNPRSN